MGRILKAALHLGQKRHKFIYTISIYEIKFFSGKPMECYLEITRGRYSFESTKFLLEPNIAIHNLDLHFTLISTLFKSTKSSEFNSKNLFIKVLESNKMNEIIGEAIIDLKEHCENTIGKLFSVPIYSKQFQECFLKIYLKGKALPRASSLYGGVTQNEYSICGSTISINTTSTNDEIDQFITQIKPLEEELNTHIHTHQHAQPSSNNVIEVMYDGVVKEGKENGNICLETMEEEKKNMYEERGMYNKRNMEIRNEENFLIKNFEGKNRSYFSKNNQRLQIFPSSQLSPSPPINKSPPHLTKQLKSPLLDVCKPNSPLFSHTLEGTIQYASITNDPQCNTTPSTEIFNSNKKPILNKPSFNETCFLPKKSLKGNENNNKKHDHFPSTFDDKGDLLMPSFPRTLFTSSIASKGELSTLNDAFNEEKLVKNCQKSTFIKKNLFTQNNTFFFENNNKHIHFNKHKKHYFDSLKGSEKTLYKHTKMAYSYHQKRNKWAIQNLNKWIKIGLSRINNSKQKLELDNNNYPSKLLNTPSLLTKEQRKNGPFLYTKSKLFNKKNTKNIGNPNKLSIRKNDLKNSSFFSISSTVHTPKQTVNFLPPHTIVNAYDASTLNNKAGGVWGGKSIDTEAEECEEKNDFKLVEKSDNIVEGEFSRFSCLDRCNEGFIGVYTDRENKENCNTCNELGVIGNRYFNKEEKTSECIINNMYVHNDISQREKNFHKLGVCSNYIINDINQVNKANKRVNYNESKILGENNEELVPDLSLPHNKKTENNYQTKSHSHINNTFHTYTQLQHKQQTNQAYKQKSKPNNNYTQIHNHNKQSHNTLTHNNHIETHNYNTHTHNTEAHNNDVIEHTYNTQYTQLLHNKIKQAYEHINFLQKELLILNNTMELVQNNKHKQFQQIIYLNKQLQKHPRTYYFSHFNANRTPPPQQYLNEISEIQQQIQYTNKMFEAEKSKHDSERRQWEMKILELRNEIEIKTAKLPNVVQIRTLFQQIQILKEAVLKSHIEGRRHREDVHTLEESLIIYTNKLKEVKTFKQVQKSSLRGQIKVLKQKLREYTQNDSSRTWLSILWRNSVTTFIYNISLSLPSNTRTI